MDKIKSINEWVNSNKKILKIYNSLNDDSSIKLFNKAFRILSEKLKIHKYIDSLNEKDELEFEKINIISPRSFSEEIGLLSYLYPKRKIKQILFEAAYNTHFKKYDSFNKAAEIHFSSKESIPPDYLVYYLGHDATTKMYFVKENESWNKKGVKYAAKIIRDKEIVLPFINKKIF